MILLASYLVKVIICSGILLLYYYLALRNKLFHQWNRFYLLAAVILSITVPVFQITILEGNEKQSAPIQMLHAVQSAGQYLDEITIIGNKTTTPGELILFLYALISLFLFGWLLLSFIKILSIIRSHTVNIVKNIRFINTRLPGTPFSFFSYIFWNEQIDLRSEAGQQVFQHELVHVKERHSLDKLFLQVILIVFWCNPFFWIIRRELKMIHEFIADKKAVAEHGTGAFAAMILQAQYPQHFLAFTNQFFQTSIKRRLAMLTKIQNQKLNYISRLIALLVIVLVVLSFTIKTEKVITPRDLKGPGAVVTNAAAIVQDTIPKVREKGKKLKVDEIISQKKKNNETVTYDVIVQKQLPAVPVDTVPRKVITQNNQPVFEISEKEASIDITEWRQFITKNLQPLIEQAANTGAGPGQYSIPLKMIIEKDGTVSNAQALHDIGYGLSGKLEKFVLNSPKWQPAMQNGKPVRSYYTKTVTFVISEQ